ncbi:DUF930 domain-containing protein [Mesorhizobium sp. IMUNJ 23232]|uniref:DUF930 domain-containing protein n=1 Tax=Mesorhizobium sp. IMUNJ 23232 TaxID=3376064 RepID=UPI003796D913
MPALFHSTSVAMLDQMPEQRRVFVGALAASLGLHLLIAAPFLFDLPSLPQPQEEEAIKVDLVPPPEPPEKPKAEPPPAPEPPKPPKPEKPQQAKAEPPPAPAKETAPPAPALRPVVQFGEKDAGPRQASDGDSAEEGSTPPAAPSEADEKELAEPPTVTAAGAAIQVPPPGTPGTKAPEAAKPAEAQKTPKLRKAKKLFSASTTGDPIATTAMGDMPRGMRVGELCASEIRQQLLHASPPYLAERYPIYELKDGTVLEARRAAFRAGGQWYDLSFRCEVDADATKVVSFAFGIGDLIPRSEWSRRKPPLQ